MYNTICALLLLSCFTIFQLEAADDTCSAQTSTTAKLKKSILCGYDKTERPVKLLTTNVTVRVTMWPNTFFYSDENNELVLNAWMVWEWTDEFLTWDPSQHDNIQTLHFDHSEIWLPDVYLRMPSYLGFVTRAVEEGSCNVQSNGAVRCFVLSTYLALCASDLTKWPYDTHNCTVSLGSWWYSNEQLDLISKSNPLHDEFLANLDWELLSFKQSKKVERHEKATFTFIDFNFLIKRHAGGHAATVLVPALVLTVLTLVSFWLEPLGSNRFTVCGMNVLVHCLYLQYLGDQIPSNGDSPPIMVLFYRDSLLLTGVSLLVAAVVRYLTTASGVAPAWISNSINWIVSSKPGQLLLLSELSKPKEETPTTEGSGAEEGPEIVAPSQIKPAVKWNIIAVLLDRICFIVFLLTYFVLILALVP